MDLLPQWHDRPSTRGAPYLREPGVTDEQIETMLVTIPRRYVEHTGIY
jgi:phosphotriesterase-related protein